MNGRTARDGARRDGWAVESRWEKALERGEYVTGNVVRGREVNKFPVETEDGAVDRAAEPNSVRCDSVEHRLNISVRLADDAQDLARRRLLVECCRQLAIARLKLLEQPYILNGNHGLVGEGLEERNLIVRESPGLAAGHYDCSDRLVVMKQRHRGEALEATDTSE